MSSVMSSVQLTLTTQKEKECKKELASYQALIFEWLGSMAFGHLQSQLMQTLQQDEKGSFPKPLPHHDATCRRSQLQMRLFS